jgi:23S rRNA (uracil1939-C5)-methyltransferase
VVAGFHELERPGRIADIDHRCLLPEPALARAWRDLRAEWGTNASRLPAGSTLRLTLRTNYTGHVTLLIEGGYGHGQPAELLERVPALAGIWRRTRDGTTTPLAGAPHVTEDWHGETVELAGGMFLQVNRAAAALLESHVVNASGDVRGLTVVDAYCGVGLYARRFERAGARVTGIELDPLAVAEARRACAGAAVLEGRVEDLLESVLPASLVVMNPPRAGVHAAVCDALHAAPPARIIYVSCDPATLARDLDRLSPQFELRAITCFDLFPQTAHVETVAELACATT